MLLRSLQLFSVVYISFIEQWPQIFGEEIMYVFGFQFVFLFKDYYHVITDLNIYLINLAVWTVICIILITLVLIFHYTKRIRHEFKHSTSLVKKWAFNILELLYIPILLNIIPYGGCTMGTKRNGYVTHDCGGSLSPLRFFLIFTSIVGSLIGLAYVIVLGLMISYRKISFKQKNHDQYLMRRELEYVLEISDSWRKQSFFIFSSFKGSKLRMLFKPLFNFVCLLLIVIHSYFGADTETKGLLFLIIFGSMIVFILTLRPYRCTSSNITIVLCFSHLFVVTCFGYVKATGLRHGLLVQKYYSICIYIITAWFILFHIVVALWCLFCRYQWPMNVETVRNSVIGYEDILNLMQKGFVIISKLRLKKSDTEMRDMVKIVNLLTDEYNNLVGDHPFQYSVLEVIDELKDTQRIIKMRERSQEVNFMSEFLSIIDERKSYL